MLFACFLVLVWYGVHYFILGATKKLIVPPPHTIFADAFFVGEAFGDLWRALLETSYLAFVGLSIATLFGIVIAILMNISKYSEKAILPWAVALQVVPIFALIPIFNIWFQNIDIWFLGFDDNFKKRLIVCVLIALFPIITNTFFGLKSGERSLHDLFSLHKSGRVTRFMRLEFRAAIPSIFVGLRIAAGLSVIGAIVAEFLLGRGPKGIGTLINRYSKSLEHPELIAAILASSLLGIVIFWGFTTLGNSLTRHWHTSSQNLKQ